MSIPTDFQFSQSSLQDFEICPRRFELRYLWQLRWPAIEAEPIQEAERLRQLGVDFHRLVQRHLVGVEETALTDSLTEAEPELQRWWQNYLDHVPPTLAGATLYPEIALSTPLAGFRLIARFDLIAIQPDGTFWIIDWKTTDRKPERDHLARHLQTRIYPYVLAAAGSALNQGQAIDPAQIKMMYWYPQSPDQPQTFDYNAAQFQQSEADLSRLIKDIQGVSSNGGFALTEKEEMCHNCVYRSFCDRGVEAGSLALFEVESEETLDLATLEWDQIAEVQF